MYKESGCNKRTYQVKTHLPLSTCWMNYCNYIYDLVSVQPVITVPPTSVLILYRPLVYNCSMRSTSSTWKMTQMASWLTHPVRDKLQLQTILSRFLWVRHTDFTCEGRHSLTRWEQRGAGPSLAAEQSKPGTHIICHRNIWTDVTTGCGFLFRSNLFLKIG